MIVSILYKTTLKVKCQWYRYGTNGSFNQKTWNCNTISKEKLYCDQLGQETSYQKNNKIIAYLFVN